MIGSTLADRYRVDAHLARGTWGTSTVWLGTDLDTGARIVVKHYNLASETTLRDNEVRVQTIMRDSYRLARMLHHEGDSIVKEYVPGETVNQYRGPSDPALARRTVLAAAELAAEIVDAGLSACHALRPNNFMVAGRSVENCNAPKWQRARRYEVFCPFQVLARYLLSPGELLPAGFSRWAIAAPIDERARGAVTLGRLHTRRSIWERDHRLYEVLDRHEHTEPLCHDARELRALVRDVERLA